MHTCFSCQVMIYSSDRSKNTYYFVFVLYKCGLQLLRSISREGYLYTCLFIKSKQCNLCPCQANLMCKESLSCFCGSYLYSSVFLYSLAKIGLLSNVSTLFYFKRFNRPQMGKPIQCYSRTCSIS